MFSITLTGTAAQEAFALIKTIWGGEDEERRREEERQRQNAQESQVRLNRLYDNARDNAMWSLIEFLAGGGKAIRDFLNPFGDIKAAGEKLETKQSLTTEDVLFVLADVAAFIPGGTSLKGIVNTAKAGRISKLRFSATALRHMEDPTRFVPVSILDEAIQLGKYGPDPKGSRALMYKTEMLRNGKTYQLEVLFDKKSNSVWHFMYY